MMCRTMVLPAAVRWQKDFAGALTAMKSAGIESPAQVKTLDKLSKTIAEFIESVEALDDIVAHQPHDGVLEHAKYQRDVVLPAMGATRVLADKLELMVDDGYWPLPTYREMLFIR